MDEQQTPQPTPQDDLMQYRYFISSPLYAGLDDLINAESKLFMGNFFRLSRTLRDFIISEETSNTILGIGQEYKLGSKQISQIAASIRELVLGNLFVKDFPSVLESRLGVNELTATEIVNKLISQSFGPILEDIKKIQRAKFPERIDQMKSSASAQPAAAFPQTQPIRPPVQTQPSIQRPQFNQPPVQPQSSFSRPPQVPSLPPQKPVNKPLEDELEKVANIIDLRNKPRE